MNTSGLSAVLGILQGGSALMSAAGSYYGARSQASSLQYQADMADINTKIGDMGAQSALLRGQRQGAVEGLRMRQVEGNQRADLAANGVDLGVGSAAETQAGTQMMKNEDLATIHANAVQDAWGYRINAMNSSARGTMARATASGINPGLSAGSTLLTSAPGLFRSYLGYKGVTKGPGAS